jgi:hypothetical protein
VARLLLLILGCAAVYWLIRRVTQGPTAPAASRNAPADAPGVLMLQCAFCGIHFPQQDALRGRDGRIFCSREHEQSAIHAGER